MRGEKLCFKHLAYIKNKFTFAISIQKKYIRHEADINNTI